MHFIGDLIRPNQLKIYRDVLNLDTFRLFSYLRQLFFHCAFKICLYAMICQMQSLNFKLLQTPNGSKKVVFGVDDFSSAMSEMTNRSRAKPGLKLD